MSKSFVGKITTLLSGTVIAQVFSFFLLPIISRFYLPSEIGKSETFIAIILTLSVGINAGYEFAIMLPSQKKEALHLTRLGGLISVVLSLLIFVILLLSSFLVPLSFFEKIPFSWTFLIPVSVLMEGFMQSFRVLMNREGKYKLITSGKLFNVIFKNGLSVLIGLVSGSYIWLIVAFFAGQGINLLIYSIGAYHSGLRFTPIRLAVLFALMKKYKDFLQFATLSSWLNSLTKRVHYFLMPFFFIASSPILGVFGMAEKILMIPIFLSIATGDVFYQKIAEIKENQTAEIRRITLKTFYFLLVSGMVIYGILCIPGKPFYAWVLGEAYQEVSVYFRAFAFHALGTFIVIPLSFLVDVKRKLGQFLLLNSTLLVIRIIAFLLGGMGGFESKMITYYGIGSAIIVIIQLVYLLSLVSTKPIITDRNS